jgi:hypothetical protein
MGSYDEDFYEWTATTAEALRQGRFADVDVENVAEEIESMGRRDLHELASRLRGLLEHKLKLSLIHGAVLDMNKRGWMATIRRQQQEIRTVLKSSPSLRRRIPELLPDAYVDAARALSEDYDYLEVHPPEVCPWTAEELL